MMVMMRTKTRTRTRTRGIIIKCGCARSLTLKEMTHLKMWRLQKEFAKGVSKALADEKMFDKQDEKDSTLGLFDLFALHSARYRITTRGKVEQKTEDKEEDDDDDELVDDDSEEGGHEWTGCRGSSWRWWWER